MNNPDTIIFLHIPKTAGTTLNQVLQQQYTSSESFLLGANAQASIDEYRDLPLEKKEAIRLVAGHTAFGFHNFVPGSFTYFTFLREPVERVVSFYHYVKGSPQHYLNQAAVNEFSGIVPFLESGITKMVDNGQTRMVSGTWLEPAFGEINADIFHFAKRNLEHYFSVVGLTEQFDASLVLLKEYFHWHDIHYVRQNVTNVTRKDRQLTVQEQEVVEQYNQWDKALYAYALEIFARQISNAGPEFAHRLESFKLSNARNKAVRIKLWQTMQRVKRFSIRKAIRNAFS